MAGHACLIVPCVFDQLAIHETDCTEERSKMQALSLNIRKHKTIKVEMPNLGESVASCALRMTLPF